MLCSDTLHEHCQKVFQNFLVGDLNEDYYHRPGANTITLQYFRRVSLSRTLARRIMRLHTSRSHTGLMLSIDHILVSHIICSHMPDLSPQQTLFQIHPNTCTLLVGNTRAFWLMVAWPPSVPTTVVILVVDYISELTIHSSYVHPCCVKEMYNTSFLVNFMQQIVHSWYWRI